MSATGSRVISWQRPVTTVTGDHNDEREQRYEPISGTFSVYLKQRQGGARLTSLGYVRAHLYSLRWTAPIGWPHTVDEGWRFTSDDGREYEVLDCTKTANSYRIMAQKVG